MIQNINENAAHAVFYGEMKENTCTTFKINKLHIMYPYLWLAGKN